MDLYSYLSTNELQQVLGHGDGDGEAAATRLACTVTVAYLKEQP